MPRGKSPGRLKACRKRPLSYILLFALVLVTAEAPAFSRGDISVSATRIGQGESATLAVRTEKAAEPHVLWLGGRVFPIPDRNRENWFAFLGVDLGAEPGRALLEVELLPSGNKQRVEISIEPKDWGVRVLTLPREMVELDEKTLARARRESRTMQEIFAAPPLPPRWSGPFARPLQGEVVGPFGRRSIINEMPRSPHSGVDLRAAKGTQVHSVHDGRVVLAGEHFFSGRSVVIDHGGAVQSMYFHLEEIKVQQGENVARGQVIGLVGATGRATGPHLHFGMRVNGARVDPMQIIVLSEQMERP